MWMSAQGMALFLSWGPSENAKKGLFNAPETAKKFKSFFMEVLGDGE
jgi:hypothetical protein